MWDRVQSSKIRIVLGPSYSDTQSCYLGPSSSVRCQALKLSTFYSILRAKLLNPYMHHSYITNKSILLTSFSNILLISFIYLQHIFSTNHKINFNSCCEGLCSLSALYFSSINERTYALSDFDAPLYEPKTIAFYFILFYFLHDFLFLLIQMIAWKEIVK